MATRTLKLTWYEYEPAEVRDRPYGSDRTPPAYTGPRPNLDTPEVIEDATDRTTEEVRWDALEAAQAAGIDLGRFDVRVEEVR